MNDYYNDMTIEAYLDGSLEDSQLKGFKDQLAKDENLAKAVEVHTKALQMFHIYGREERNKNLLAVQEELDKEGFFLNESIFDPFLDEELDTPNLAKINYRLQQDKDFANDLAIHQKGREVLQVAGKNDRLKAIQSAMDELEEEGFFSETKKRGQLISLFSRRAFAYAAAIGLLLVAGLWLVLQPATPEQIYAQHYSKLEDVLSS